MFRQIQESLVRIIFLALIKTAIGAELQSYNVDLESITVSGISSGAAFATQFHVAFSEQIAGAGLYAGVPYICAYQASAVGCMETPALVNADILITETEGLSMMGLIDNVKYLANDKVLVFNGQRDEVVGYGILEKIVKFYNFFMTEESNLKSVDDLPANHCVPTNNTGTDCGVLNKDNFLENCNYPAMEDLFQFLYGDSVSEGEASVDDIRNFSQDEFFAGFPILDGMSSTGYIYVPPQCEDKQKQCRLHIHFHGCSMNYEAMGFNFIENVGILQAAMARDTIVLMPQVAVILNNPYGCWNWFGYLPQDFAIFYTRSGRQMQGVHKMMSRVAGI